MATILKYESGREAYPHVVNHVLQHGVKRSPRGRETLDAGTVVVTLNNPRFTLPLGTGRKLSHRIAAAEAIQLIGAFSDPQLLPSSFDEYKEDSGWFHGAYGDRIGEQMIAVVEKLRQDPSTRQAIISLWDPKLDNLPGKRDYPCTLMMQFAVDVDARLQMTTVMRSNDVWLGTPYDWFQFTQLQLTVADLLRRQPGQYHHIALSLHLYVDDVEKVANLHPYEHATHYDVPHGLARSFDLPAETMHRARKVAYERVPHETSSEEWYRDHLR